MLEGELGLETIICDLMCFISASHLLLYTRAIAHDLPKRLLRIKRISCCCQARSCRTDIRSQFNVNELYLLVASWHI